MKTVRGITQQERGFQRDKRLLSNESEIRPWLLTFQDWLTIIKHDGRRNFE